MSTNTRSGLDSGLTAVVVVRADLVPQVNFSTSLSLDKYAEITTAPAQTSEEN